MLLGLRVLRPGHRTTSAKAMLRLSTSLVDPVNTMAAPRQPSAALKAGIALFSTTVSLLAAELVVRVVDGGAHDALHLFQVTDEPPFMGLSEGSQRLRAPDGHVTTVQLDAEGQRVPNATGATTLVVGDSQVLGLGVEGAQTFCHLARTPERPIACLGTPGWSLKDALDAAASWETTHAAPLRKVVVVLNESNDLHEAGQSIPRRHVIHGGWLLNRTEAPSWWHSILDSPVGKSHLLVRGLSQGMRTMPRPSGPDEVDYNDALHLLGHTLVNTAQLHPAWTLTVLVLPTKEALISDHHALAEDLAAVMGGEAPTVVSLHAALRTVDAPHLNNDPHLSVDGHAAASRVLRDVLKGDALVSP